jgi:hypothetical protein
MYSLLILNTFASLLINEADFTENYELGSLAL